MKTIILAAGRGKRLGELSNDRNKCKLQVCGKPIIEYSLDCAVGIDSSAIIIVVGYKGGEIIDRYGESYKGKKIIYVKQKDQYGLVHAVECASEAIDREDFMLMLGDELMINPKHKDMFNTFKNGNLFGICGVVTVDDAALVRKTYSVVQNSNNQIIRLIEKPANPQNNIMGTGNCIFKNEILTYIPQTPINQKRGEKELPDLIQCAIDDGRRVQSFNICSHYVNVNIPEEIQQVESYFAHI